jgi:L-threonylcarbamoyladenylate synthase
MQAVIRECNFPLAAPSANVSNQLSPTNAHHVHTWLAGKIPLIVDGGQSQVGIESTVLDLTVAPPKILRPGMIHAGSLAAVCGAVQTPQAGGPDSGGAARSPGLLAKHYSPKAGLLVWDWRDDAELELKIKNSKLKIQDCHIIAHTKIPASFAPGNVHVIPHDAEAFARALYAELHQCDAAGAGWIVVEAPPDLPEWSGIADRLRRAGA